MNFEAVLFGKLSAMKSALLSLIFVFCSLISSASATCFREHVIEGRALNWERKGSYKDWAKKHGLKSRAGLVSNALLGLETLMLPAARYFDFKTRKHKGTGLFCDDFIPISETPEFNIVYAQIPDEVYNEKPAFISTYKDFIYELTQKREWSRIREESVIAIHLFEARETHCLTRHFIESIGRISALAPIHIEKAKSAGLDDPSELIAKMIRYHLTGLKYSLKIDALAAPLQYQGIPIVCQDVPHIPIP